MSVDRVDRKWQAEGQTGAIGGGHSTLWTFVAKGLTVASKSFGTKSAVKRREFITLAGAAAATWPLAARAQQSGRVRRIGVLMANFDSQPRIKAFESAWPALGWVEGRNVYIDYHLPLAIQTASELTLPRSSPRRPKSFLSQAHRSWPRCGKPRNRFQPYLLESPTPRAQA
jgi:hypothetical protein